MTEDSDGKPRGKGEKSLPPLDLDKLIPKYEAASAIGPVTVRHITMGDLIALEEADREQRLDPTQFVPLLIERTVKRVDRDEALNAEDVTRLSVDPAFLEELIKGHPDLTSFEGQAASRVGKEGRKRKTVKPAVREQGEDAGTYLLRAWRSYREHSAEQFKGLGETLSKSFAGLTGALSSSGLDALLKNATASRGLQQTIDKATSRAKVSWPAFEPRLDPITIPPNPIHQTNEHLHELVESIDQMRDLAIQTAEMQRGLNDVATEILDKFVTGAKTAEKAAANSLKIAKIGLWIAVSSVVVTLAVSIAQLVMTGPTEGEIEQMARMEALAKSSRDLSVRQSALLEQSVAIERSRLNETVAAPGGALDKAGVNAGKIEGAKR